jgi:hypothetical protein
MVEPARSQITLWRCVCWINKATRAQSHTRARPPTSTHTHTQNTKHTEARTHPHTHKCTQKYIILIAFPRQQRFRESASMLRYTYIACLFINQNQQQQKIYSLDFFLTILSHLIFYVRRLNMCHKRSSSPATQINLALIHVPKRYLYRFAR